MRRCWIVALALIAIILALVHPAYTLYIAAQAHATYSDMPSQIGVWALTSQLSMLASYLSLGAAAIATTLAALSRLWGRFAMLLVVVVLFSGGLNPIGGLAVYFAAMYLAAIPVLTHTTGGDVLTAFVGLSGPQVVTAVAALLWAAFPGQPRVPAMPPEAPHRPPQANARRGDDRSVWGILLLLACASGVLFTSCLLLVSVRAH